jgi:large subunit ribosomal protein L19e
MVDVRRLAAEILGVGESRIKIKPEALERLEEVSTRADVRRLIKEGLIEVEPPKGNSRGRWRELHEKRKKGRRRGPGSRKGAKGARQDPKRAWINRIRTLRRYLKWLKDNGIIDPKTWRKLYRMAKGGYFRDLAHLKQYLITNKIVPPDKIR